MSAGPVTVQKNRALPLKAQLFDSNGFAVTEFDLVAPPVVQVRFAPEGSGQFSDVSDEALPPNESFEGNQFVFRDGRWRFNLQTKDYFAPGTYAITMVSGDAVEYEVTGCAALFVVRR